MSLIDLLILFVVSTAVGFAVGWTIYRRRKGKGCGCGCDTCPYHKSCEKAPNDHKNKR